MKKYKHIIWDWNGTLFNDVDLCVENINWLLQKYNLPAIDKDKYREIFTFPVIEYYRRAGFDLTSFDFEKIGKQWMDRYEQKKFQAKLTSGAEEVIRKISELGIEQFILSAYSQGTLVDLVEQFGLKKYFKNIVGLDNIYAESKLDIARKLIEKLNCAGNSILLVGDTVHDYEVSRELNCDCLLFSLGHQSKNALEKCGVKVIDKLEEVLRVVEG